MTHDKIHFETDLIRPIQEFLDTLEIDKDVNSEINDRLFKVSKRFCDNKPTSFNERYVSKSKKEPKKIMKDMPDLSKLLKFKQNV